MSGKRLDGGFSLGELQAKKAKMDQVGSSASGSAPRHRNPYLSRPVDPVSALQDFLKNVRRAALKYLPKEHTRPIEKPFCEVEARLGILKVPHASPARRVTSSGAKHVDGVTREAFDCSHQQPRCLMESGVTRSHFVRSTAAGISEASPLSRALDVPKGQKVKDVLEEEEEKVETVYTGYSNNGRVCFVGEHPGSKPATGKMESKERLDVIDLTLPAAPYDIRVSLASEKVLDSEVRQPPPGWKSKRVKRRRSYSRRDKTNAWQIDVTEVTTVSATNSHTVVDYEIEVELRAAVLLELINENDESRLRGITKKLAEELWHIVLQINPLADHLDVEEKLRDHPNKRAVQLALAQCGAFKKFVDGGAIHYESPIARPNQQPPPALSNVKFVGCMPVNFSRHNLEEIQRSPDDAYFLSEKTDGVRYFMVFTCDTVVLVDRAMRGKQPIPSDPSQDPFASILPLVKPGTVLDGEVVMNRRSGRKPRPIFIVFDVLAISSTEPVLHLNFEERLKHLHKATFRQPNGSGDIFDPHFVADPKAPLPLVRKNFVKRTDVDELLSHVVEERGMRCYTYRSANGELHYHLTDGIIFQPNLPYVCGTDRNLLKWKYLDTVTIDIEIMPLLHTDEDDVFRVACLGEEGTRVDMSRYVMLPKSERMKLEADRFETGGRITEVGFDPEIGEFYYLTMREDKIAPNHISTVLGTLLELAESLTTDELRYRMSIPAGARDTYRKDMRGMIKQLLDHHRKNLRDFRRHHR